MKINLVLISLLVISSHFLIAQQSLLPPPAGQPVWTYVNSGVEWPPQNYRVQFRYADEAAAVGSHTYQVIELVRINLNGDTSIHAWSYVREVGSALLRLIDPDAVIPEEVTIMDTSVEPGSTVLLHSLYFDYEEGHNMTLTEITEAEGEDGVVREKYSFENLDEEPGGGSIHFIVGVGFTNRPFDGISSSKHDLYDLQCLYLDGDELVFFDPNPNEWGTDPDAEEGDCGVLGPILSTADGAERPVLNLYPNPVRDRLFFDLPDGETGLREVRITDMTGRTVLHRNGVMRDNLEVGNLPPGLYLINFTVLSGQQSVGKFVKAD